jgi:tetratricopeptide (TPR) repeat protein
MPEPASEQSIFLHALGLPTAAERAAYLDEVCRDNTGLRAGVEALLAAHQRLGGALPPTTGGEPAGVVAAESPPVSDGGGVEGGAVLSGRYKLVQQIGEGGMGTVWMAQQQEPVKRLVALKVIKPGMDSKQVLARFEAERQALALMDHPHIAKVLDGGATESGRPYFVMELVKGVPITRYCDEHRLTPKQRLELFVPVCQAVQHAHQKGIIHRDLKPSNILVAPYDGRPVPKVIDFGIAKATGQQLTEHTLVTGFGAVVGTLEYMSPEQAKLNQLDIDTRSDIYSLGVLLYELLTGTTPLERKRLKQAAMLEVLRLIREEEPPKPSTRLSSTDELPSVAANRGLEPRKLSGLVRGELDWIVMKALEKDRGRRYETANGFAQDIERFLHDEPVLACPPSAWYRFRKFVRRNKTALAVAGLILFFIALMGGGGGWIIRDRAAREQEVVKERLERKAALDGEVERLLGEAGDLMEQGKWPEAQAPVERADKLLASAGRTDRPPRLRELQKELDMARRLEDLYRDPAEADVTTGDWALDARFARAFQEFGIDIDALDPADSAALIGRKSIRQDLIKALDDRAAMRRRRYRDTRINDERNWKKLVELAQKADGDEGRNRVRAAWLSRDRQAVEKLVDTLPLRDVPPATLHLLGAALGDLGALEKALSVLRPAQRQHPNDPWINDTLAWLSWKECKPPRYEDALRFYTAASALRPQSARWHANIAGVLQSKGALGEAIAEYSRVIELTPEDEYAWRFRGSLYRQAGLYKKAIADYSKACELDATFWAPHDDLGTCLLWDGQLDKAIAAYRKATELLQPVLSRQDAWLSATVYTNLGKALKTRGLLDEAIAAYREAVRLDKNGDKNFAEIHYGLGHVLQVKGRLDEAIAAYREAIRIQEDYAEAHCNLGQVLLLQGEFRQALEERRRGHELGSKKQGWAYPSAQWVRQSERLVELDGKLPAFLEGKTMPASPAERIELAQLCAIKHLHRAAARFYGEAFDAQPPLADNLGAFRYNAACAAVQAGCGVGKDADKLDGPERARLRRQALDWLRADLEAQRRRLDKEPAGAAAKVARGLQHWLADPDFVGVRGSEALAKLPPAEQQEWGRLWAEVAEHATRAARDARADAQRPPPAAPRRAAPPVRVSQDPERAGPPPAQGQAAHQPMPAVNPQAGRKAGDSRVPSPVVLLRISVVKRDSNQALRAAVLHLPYVYAIARGGDLWVFKLPTKVEEKPGQELQEVGQVCAAGDGRALAVVGDTLLCSRDGGLEAYALDDPGRPRPLGKFGTERLYQTWALVRHQDRLIRVGTAGLSVFDVSQPARPGHLGTTPVPRHSVGGCVVGGRLYVAQHRLATEKGSRDGIAVYDLADPGALKELGFVETPASPYHLLPAGKDRLAVLMDDRAQLFSLADPLKPAALGQPVATAARCGAVLPVDDRSYLITGRDVFRLEDKALIPVGGFSAGGNYDGAPYHGCSEGGYAVITLSEAVVVLRPEKAPRPPD